MREPTQVEVQFAWWRSALRGQKQPLCEMEPHCGWYKTRAWSRGPFLPGRIWLEQDIDFWTGELVTDETFAAEIGGEKWEANRAWMRLSKYPVTVAEFKWLTAMQPLMKPKPEQFQRRSVFADVY